MNKPRNNTGTGEAVGLSAPGTRSRAKRQLATQVSALEGQSDHPRGPSDVDLLERARTLWQIGDWQSLNELDRDILQHHPERATLALLAAAGRLQTGEEVEARAYVNLAREWGCSSKLISQCLISGVHNSIGRAAAIGNLQHRALEHFQSAIAVAMSGSDIKRLAQVRIGEQLHQLALPTVDYSQTASDGLLAQTVSLLPDEAAIRLKAEVKAEIHAEQRANNPNPYAHNRTLTPGLGKALREFAADKLGLKGIRPAYIDYLAAKAIHIERNCVGRLATTVQDAVARQLVTECVVGDNICILEIGALYGVSLAILYNHAITRFATAKVVCLDPFDGYYGKALDALLNQPVNDLAFIRNMYLSHVPEADYGVIKHYSTKPEALAAARELPINLLIIDGDHSYEGVKYDFDTYFPLVQPGGYIIFDDYSAKEWPGVQKFIDRDLQDVEDFEYLGFISRTAVGRKRRQ